MNRIAGRAGITLLLVLVLVGGIAFFGAEFVAEADRWVVFSGSPHVYNGNNIDCGVVTDRENILLADLRDGRTYSNSLALRKATVHWLGDRYGSINAPALSNYAAQIAGFDLLNGVYRYGRSSGVVKLTFSAQIQQAALEALGDRKGTVSVYNYKTGELLCAVTTPTYDPDHVPDIEGDTTGAYEGAYVNRFTQSTYIPGSIFKIVTLAAALETVGDIQQQRFTCTGSYTLGADRITCESTHGEQDLKTAFRNSCNCAFAQIALQVGGETLEWYAKQFGVTDRITFDGITTAAGNFEAANTSAINVAWSGVGQYKDQINPCAFLTFMGAVAGGGKGTVPYLVEQIEVENHTTYAAQTQYADRIMSAATAQVLQEYLRNNVQQRYGDEHFPGLQVCAKTGTAEVGGDQKPNAMLAGYVMDDEYPLAFMVCVEDAGYGGTVCIPIASKVLAACKTAMDELV